MTNDAGFTAAAPRHVANAFNEALVIEFPAVIQEIVVTTDATTMRLDVSVIDVTPLSNLVDQEITVTIAEKPPETSAPTEKKPPRRSAGAQKSTTPEKGATSK